MQGDMHDERELSVTLVIPPDQVFNVHLARGNRVEDNEGDDHACLCFDDD